MMASSSVGYLRPLAAPYPRILLLLFSAPFMGAPGPNSPVIRGGVSRFPVTPKIGSKLEKLMIKLGIIKSYKQDDLKIVEGIGPKIEELLHNAGIKTWKALSEASPASIKEILTAAGPNFQLADPETWPKQAELADAGKWAELEEYQSFLQGGKG